MNVEKIDWKNQFTELDEVVAKGNENVLGTHKSTLEITKENYLTLNGNCIIGINSNKSVFNFSPELKNAIQQGKKILVKIVAGPYEDHFFGWGSRYLSLKNEVSIVFRKSNYICDRTALINCTKSAREIDRKIINYMKSPENSLILKMLVEN